MTATAGVVVVNYGAHHLVERNFAPLSGVQDLNVVVVDNFHSDAERATMRALAHTYGWSLVEPATNLGFGIGSNLGAASAIDRGCDVVLLLNPDAKADVDACQRLAALARARPDALISPVVDRPDGSRWFSGAEVDMRTGRVRRTPGEFESRPGAWLSGAAMSAHASFWTQLGGFAPEFFLYWEDVDISWRCVDVGGNLILATDVIVEHDPGGTQRDSPSDRGKSPMYYFHNCRNRLLFASLRLPTRTLLAWIAATPVESWRILSRGGRRHMVTAPGGTLQAVRGSVVGLALAVRELSRRAVAAGVWRRSAAGADRSMGTAA